MEATYHSETSVDFQTIARRYIPEDRNLHLVLVYKFIFTTYYIVTDLINMLPGNSPVNTVQHATVEEAVFSVDPTDAPVYWLDSDQVICVYCRSMSVPRLYNESRERIGTRSTEEFKRSACEDLTCNLKTVCVL
jgi:hypothetical protein